MAIANRMGMTETLPDLIRAGTAILRDRLDRLMLRFRTLDAEFYAGYQGARSIIDRRGPGEPDPEDPPVNP